MSGRVRLAGAGAVSGAAGVVSGAAVSGAAGVLRLVASRAASERSDVVPADGCGAGGSGVGAGAGAEAGCGGSGADCGDGCAGAGAGAGCGGSGAGCGAGCAGAGAERALSAASPCRARAFDGLIASTRWRHVCCCVGSSTTAASHNHACSFWGLALTARISHCRASLRWPAFAAAMPRCTHSEGSTLSGKTECFFW